jgi:DNA-binding NarL/FixJ family response regulator
LILQKIAQRELQRAPIRMAVAASLLEDLEFEDNLLNTSAGIEVVGRTADSGFAVELIAKLEPDMVLVSIGTYVFDSLKVIRALRRRFPKMVIAAVSNAECTSLRTFCGSSETCGFVYKFRFQEDFERVLTRRFQSRYAPSRRDKVPFPSHFPFSLSPNTQTQKGET